MGIIAIIEDQTQVKTILPHLGLWETRNHDPPQTIGHSIPACEADLTIDESYSQLPLIDYWSQ